MRLRFVLKFLYFYCALSVFAQNFVPPGKVFIGQSENDNVQSLNFSINQPNSFFYIPVFIKVFNESTGVSAVRVTCGLSPSSNGFSSAVFAPAVISISPPLSGPYFGNVNFSVPQPGRMSALRCWCISPEPFTKELTTSDAKLMTVFPSGVVNLYSSLFTMGQPIYVKLSQVVRSNSVVVICQGGALNFQPKTVLVGSQMAEVFYTPLNNVSSVNINCFGISANNGYQFMAGNSTGSSATVVPFVALVSLIPNQTLLNRIRMSALLSINKAPSIDSITFSCSVSTVFSWSDVENITNQIGCSVAPRTFPAQVNASESSTTSPPVTSNATDLWQLKQSDFVFSINDPKSYLFRVVDLERVKEVTGYAEELVVTRCCNGEPASNNPFFNSSAFLVAAVTLTPPLPINWTIATASVNLTLETPIVNPAFKDLAPCPCNLTARACDANCCCDTECSPSDIETFKCIEGYFGGMEGERSRDFCDVTSYDAPGWFPIVCIQKVNTGYLGYYFFSKGLIRNQTAFDATIGSYTTQFSFRQTQAIFPGEPDGSQVGYKEGLAVKTGLLIPPATFQFGPNYMLTLPVQNIWSAPVRFLVDTDSYLVQNMSRLDALCAIDSSLSALMYAQSPTWGSATGPLVLKEQGTAAVTSINVNFLCDSDGTKYVVSRVTYKDVVPSNETRFFGSPSDEANDCRFNDDTGAFVCGNYTVGGPPTPESLPPRCAWDDGYTTPPKPSLNGTLSACDNSVVRVLYNFTWSGQAILYLNATIILAPVPFNTSRTNESGVEDVRPAVLSQRFITMFVSKKVNGSATEDDGMKVLPVSGNPGYNVNLPVISGISVPANDSSQVLYIDTNSTSRLSLWKPGFSSLCDGAVRDSVLFRINSIGSCTLRLNFSNMENCDHLRKQVLSGQDSLMPSNYISLVGNPKADNITDWTKIIREDISFIISDPLSGVATTYEPALSNTQTTQSRTTEASFSTLPPSNYYSELKGSCPSIPSAIHLNVLYALAGKSNHQPIHRIVGAKISYTLTTWRWSCAGASGVSCRFYSSDVQSFQLTSSVNFIQVPPVPEPEPSLYEEMASVPMHICKKSICWHETFYPFLNVEGLDQERNIAIGLSLLIIIIYFVFLTTPFLQQLLKRLQE